jgi:hypothetical protein
MFRKMMVAVALMVSAVAFAGQTAIDTSGLSDAQVAELKAHAAKVVADTAKVPDVKDAGAMVTLAATWGTQAAAAAEGFAKAINIAAKELGVTVNDFLGTDAGKLTAVLIIWKVAGASIAHLFFGLLFMTIGMIVTRMIYLRLFTKEFTKVPYNRFFGMFTGEKLVRVPKSFSDLDNDGEWLAFWVMIVVCMGSLLIGAAII